MLMIQEKKNKAMIMYGAFKIQNLEKLLSKPVANFVDLFILAMSTDIIKTPKLTLRVLFVLL